MKKLDVNVVLRAVRAHCLECSGGSRNEVERCRLKECSLYPYRVQADETKGKDEQLNLFGEERGTVAGLSKKSPDSKRRR